MNSAMVWFHSFAEPDCLVDDDEYEEVVSDVQGLSSRYGMVSRQFVADQTRKLFGLVFSSELSLDMCNAVR